MSDLEAEKDHRCKWCTRTWFCNWRRTQCRYIVLYYSVKFISARCGVNIDFTIITRVVDIADFNLQFVYSHVEAERNCNFSPINEPRF